MCLAHWMTTRNYDEAGPLLKNKTSILMIRCKCTCYANNHIYIYIYIYIYQHYINKQVQKHLLHSLNRLQNQV